MFGFSFGELLVISLVTLVAVGPQKLPGMLKTMGHWARKLRKMTLDVRQQTGIDEMLRAEGIQLSELRSLMRGYHGGFPGPAPAPAPAPAPVAAPVTSTPRYEDPYQNLEPDPTREYPLEGADSYGALADDLLEPAGSTEVAAAPGAPEPKPVETVTQPATVEAKPLEAKPLEAKPLEAKPLEAKPVETEARPAEPSAPEIEPEPEPEPVVAKPPSAPARSVPPPPPSRTGVPRPSAGAPPPPPRRSAAPPRPEPSSPVAKPEAPAGSSPHTPGTANGNG